MSPSMTAWRTCSEASRSCAAKATDDLPTPDLPPMSYGLSVPTDVNARSGGGRAVPPRSPSARPSRSLAPCAARGLEDESRAWLSWVEAGTAQVGTGRPATTTAVHRVRRCGHPGMADAGMTVATTPHRRSLRFRRLGPGAAVMAAGPVVIERIGCQ